MKLSIHVHNIILAEVYTYILSRSMPLDIFSVMRDQECIMLEIVQEEPYLMQEIVFAITDIIIMENKQLYGILN